MEVTNYLLTGMILQVGGGFKWVFGIFTPKIGEDEPILTSIFFKWVESKPPTIWFFSEVAAKMKFGNLQGENCVFKPCRPGPNLFGPTDEQPKKFLQNPMGFCCY